MAVTLTLPFLGEIDRQVGTAAFQYNPQIAGVLQPAFLNGSNGNGGGEAGSSCGAFGLRYLYFDLYPFDNSSPKKIAQIGGGSISAFGVVDCNAALSNPTQYGAISGSNTGDYLVADCEDGTLLLDAGSNQQGLQQWNVCRFPYPSSGLNPSSFVLPPNEAQQNIGANVELYWNNHASVRNPVAGTGFDIWSRNPQPGQVGNPCPYNFTYYWNTGFSGGLGQPATVSLPNLGACGLTSGAANSRGLGGASNSKLGSVVWWQNNQWNALYSGFTPLSNFYETDGGPQTNPVAIAFSNFSDNALLNNGSYVCPFTVIQIPGGHYMLHAPATPAGTNVYYVVLGDLSGYYRLVFTGVDANSTKAVYQASQNTGSAYGQGFGLDATGYFWFQLYGGSGLLPVLYSTLGYSLDLIISGLSAPQFPVVNFQALDCRRIFSPARVYEG